MINSIFINNFIFLSGIPIFILEKKNNMHLESYQFITVEKDIYRIY